MASGTFTIVPRGPFSLSAAAGFGFGPRQGDERGADLLRLAFCVDGFSELAGVVLRQDRGRVHGEVHGARDVEAVRRQVARILSLDHDGDAWLAVGHRDPVIGRLQAEHPGLRPVLFHSPYEAAAWAVISARRSRQHAVRVRRELARSLGATFDLEGESHDAFPPPEHLRELEPMAGLSEERVLRLHRVADAALSDALDPERLLRMGPEQSAAQVRELRGIGAFYAELVVVRAVGFTDALPLAEPRSLACAAHFYGLERTPDPAAFVALAEAWRPFRTWAVVLLRVAGDRAGVPHEPRRR